jgi:hypothetical protein
MTEKDNDGKNLSRSLREKFGTDPAYRQKLVETMKFVDDYRNGRVARARFAETMTTSDFPGLLGGVIDRTLLGGYRSYPTSYQDWCSIYRDAKDFRTLERHYLDLGDGVLSSVKETTEYPYTDLDEGKYSYKVEKFGRKFKFSWESFVNDDLSALTTIPSRLGIAAKRTTEKLATSLICDANGPDATFFNDANGNKLALALNTANLKAAAATMADLSDAGDEPIFNDPAVLVVPPALKITALEIVKTIQTEIASGTDTKIQTPGLFGNLKVAVAPYISKIVTAGTVGKTSWFLFADPGQLERPAVEIGFLRGHEEPQLFMKAPNASMIGGGNVSAFGGDFDTDSIEFKVRHIVGGKAMDYRGAVGSFGQ